MRAVVVAAAVRKHKTDQEKFQFIQTTHIFAHTERQKQTADIHLNIPCTNTETFRCEKESKKSGEECIDERQRKCVRAFTFQLEAVLLCTPLVKWQYRNRGPCGSVVAEIPTGTKRNNSNGNSSHSSSSNSSNR